MRSWIRAALFTVLLTSLITKYYSYRTEKHYPSADFGSAVLDVLHLYKVSAEETPWGYSLKFPGCDGFLQVAPLSLNLQEAPTLTEITPPGYVRHYFYIEQSSTTLHRFPLYFEWLKQSALAFIGQSAYFPLKTALMVAEPPECRAAENIDWRLLWMRDRSHRGIDTTSAGTAR
jgi:hypothetical protein